MNPQDVIQQLSAYRFAAEDVSFRPGAVSKDKKKAQVLAYAEPRVYQRALNEIYTLWELSFSTWGEQRIIATLTFKFENQDGNFYTMSRSSTGEWDGGDKVAQGTAAEAQAFKRACVMWGLGAYFYDLPNSWVPFDEATRKFVNTPTLPAKFLPSTSSREQAFRAPTKPVQEEQGEPKLSERRAQAMVRELTKLGFDAEQQQKLTFKVLSKQVKGFQELTETEALEVWNTGRRTTPANV